MRSLALWAALRALAPTADAPAPASPDAAVIRQALCAGPCAVLTNAAAGHDASGRELFVVSVAAPHGAEKLPRTEEEAERRCIAEPYALLHLAAGKVALTEPIVTLRAHGCARGREELRINGDKLVYDVQGGQRWTWVELTTWQVAPVLHVVERYEEKFAHEGAPGQTVDEQPDAHLVSVERRLPFCGEPVHEEGSHEAPPHATFKHVEIPLAKTVGDWRAPDFKPAAVELDASGRVGQLLAGAPGRPEDARFRVALLEPTLLFIELEDDHLMSRDATHPLGDAFELAIGDALPAFPGSCMPRPGAKRPAHDGGALSVFDIAVKGPPDALKVDRVNIGPKLRLLVHLPRAPGSLCLVYDDTDDGKTVARRLGTCTLDREEPLSLGSVGTGEREGAR